MRSLVPATLTVIGPPLLTDTFRVPTKSSTLRACAPPNVFCGQLTQSSPAQAGTMRRAATAAPISRDLVRSVMCRPPGRKYRVTPTNRVFPVVCLARNFRKRGMKPAQANKIATERPRRLGYQTITAGFGHENLRMTGVVLDLLPQAIDVGFQRVRGYRRIVAPHLMQKRIARHGVARPVQVFQDVGFFFSQPDLLAGWIEQ